MILHALALLIAAAPPVAPSAEVPAVTPPARYAAAYGDALAQSVPLIVFVGQPAFRLPGCRTVEADGFLGAAGPCVVVGAPDGPRSGVDLRAVLPGRPQAGDILRAAGFLPPAPAFPPARFLGPLPCRT